MSEGQITVIIDDQIRDKQFTQAFNSQSSIAAIIEWLIDQHGLPRYNMVGDTIHYDLVRSQTGETLEHQATLRQIGILDGEELQLVSPEARLIWKLIEKLKDEIEDYIKDKLEDLAKKKLEELKETLNKTKAKDSQAEKLIKKATKSRSCSCLGIALAGGAILILVIIAVIVWWIIPKDVDDIWPSQPGKLEGNCWCEGSDLHCNDGTVERNSPECGQEVECWCDGPNFVCSDDTMERNSPECSQEVECWCDGPNLVCSDDTVQPNNPDCERPDDPQD